MIKKIINILDWTINSLLIGGLLAFSISYFMTGDTKHGVVNLLFMSIIVTNLIYYHNYKKMKAKYNTAMEASTELIKQNATLTAKVKAINNPFKQTPGLTSITQNVQVVRHAVKYETNFLNGYNELETNRRKHNIEHEARYGLMGELIDSELITIRHDDGNIGEGTKFCVAEIQVGIPYKRVD